MNVLSKLRVSLCLALIFCISDANPISCTVLLTYIDTLSISKAGLHQLQRFIKIWWVSDEFFINYSFSSENNGNPISQVLFFFSHNFYNFREIWKCASKFQHIHPLVIIKPKQFLHCLRSWNYILFVAPVQKVFEHCHIVHNLSVLLVIKIIQSRLSSSLDLKLFRCMLLLSHFS